MVQEQEVVIGICGGVGPAAGILLHQHILTHTENKGQDQGHLNVCHLSRSQDTTDRTKYLLTSPNERYKLSNPAQGMARTFDMLREAADSRNARAVVGVPCNTFHAVPIWDEFVRLSKVQSNTQIKLVHMLDETIRMIRILLPHATKIGLMSTTGTRKSRVYHDLLEPLGYEVLEVPDHLQAELHETIYHNEWGIKSTSPMIDPRARKNFHRYASLLSESGADAIIMGCTEIPMVFTGSTMINGALLIDPMVALARSLIREADFVRLKPLHTMLPERKACKASLCNSKSTKSSLCLTSNASTASMNSFVDFNSEIDSDVDNDVGLDLETLGNEKTSSTSIWDFYNDFVDRILMPIPTT